MTECRHGISHDADCDECYWLLFSGRGLANASDGIVAHQPSESGAESMTQCKEGISLENGTFLCCPQQVEDHRAAHGPFTFMLHRGPTGAKHTGWPDRCSQFGCDMERATTLSDNGAKRQKRPKGKGWKLEGISAASPWSIYYWKRPWALSKEAIGKQELPE